MKAPNQAHITNANASLELARELTAEVNTCWDSGELLQRVRPVTQELLKYWFSEEYCSLRRQNFHDGQRQAILNIIYLHEVVGVRSVLDGYNAIAPELTEVIDLAALSKPKYKLPKYAVKMATGTGKTWVMHALLLWQLLNARHEDMPGGRFTQHFLIVAPGLIVYDRLLDAFCGRLRRGKDVRDWQMNDFVWNQEVLIPPHFRQEVFSFMQNNVVTKEDGIGRKTTGEGLIALTNWNLFENQMNDSNDDDADTIPAIIDELLPVRPGKAAGNELGALDRRALRGTEIEYLQSLPDLMVINDEAHHIHEMKRGGEVEEVEWQKALNLIAEGKGDRFSQVDFSATPFDTRGTGEQQVKYYFPHIVVDFDLAAAMRQGLVKTLLLDHRQELTELATLDFRAERDEQGKVIGLSDGQRRMLRAGLTKLRKLEKDFLEQDVSKNPKMLVMCEDTTVSPYVVQCLREEGLDREDIVSIDSTAKGDVKPKEWDEIRKQLFDIDHYARPKVIVSVLMLREGFDVNNICVIVPLRSSQAPILLEQTVGRGLRLMWREPEYESLKTEDRKRVLNRHEPPTTYLDMLSIVEHPAFNSFYDELMADGLAGVDEGDMSGRRSAGDILTVPLREGWERYDFEWPVIIRAAEEELVEPFIDINRLEPFTMYPLTILRRFLASDGDTFISQDVQTKTQFGRYKVAGDLFTAANYQQYLQKVYSTVTTRFDRITSHRERPFPNLQTGGAVIVAAMDAFIRARLFPEGFDPFSGNDWKILLSKGGIVTQHIVKQFATAIYEMQNNVQTSQAVVEHRRFSEAENIKMRESYSVEVTKCIYPRLGYPTHGGGFERAFIEFLDTDGEVERFLKISETIHQFASIYYIRADGLMATYHPDFIVATSSHIYVIETKGNNRVFDPNVRQKQRATVEWIRKVNELQASARMNRTWDYILLSEDNFYSLSAGGASITDICERTKVSLAAATGDLFADVS